VQIPAKTETHRKKKPYAAAKPIKKVQKSSG
jgi:hypothetical protein